MKNRTFTYLFSGIILAYFALKGEFILLYNGIAALVSLGAFVMAYLEYKKQNHRK